MEATSQELKSYLYNKRGIPVPPFSLCMRGACAIYLVSSTHQLSAFSGERRHVCMRRNQLVSEKVRFLSGPELQSPPETSFVSGLANLLLTADQGPATCTWTTVGLYKDAMFKRSCCCSGRNTTQKHPSQIPRGSLLSRCL